MVGGYYGFEVSPYLTFVRDYWFPFAAFVGGVFFVARGCLRIIKNSSRVSFIERDMEDLKRDVSYIKGKVSAIEKFLKGYFGVSLQPSVGLVQVKSPLKLSRQGRRLLEESGFKKIYKINRARFLKLAKGFYPQLRYEAQEAAFTIMVDLADDPLLKSLKKFAFAKGKNLMDILKICGLYLRDEIIKEFDLKE